ncbi:MAG: histidinol dehydrogenase [Clostridiales bacterium]|nr:histidinol dehydrogenase [Clostridiales bacterium]
MQTIKEAKPRTEAENQERAALVSGIIARVRTEGDAALAAYNEQFDGCLRESLRVTEQEIRAAYEQVPEEMIADMRQAAANIRAFAEAQRASMHELSGFAPVQGMDLGHRIIPVSSCLCYVPGGNYPLYSTALMLGIPAKAAGVGRVCACSPAVKGTGSIEPKTLVAMDIAGVDEIYVTGGAQAIAAFTYGTASIDPVDIIVGPGNAFVTEAKKQCYGKVGIDFLAGPSEVMIIADGSGDPAVTAADLLAQSEHDFLAKGILVTTDRAFGLKVIACVEAQLTELNTAGIAAKSWADHGEVLLADDLTDAVRYANSYAPEHLEINVRQADEEYVISSVRNYGSLFIGQNTAEVFGDYASGTNHTLPTLGAARYTGGVYVGTFLKTCTYQRFSDSAMQKLAPVVERLAKGEGLSGHANAAAIRLKQ